MTPDQVSVVIPTLREEHQIAACVTSAKQAGASEVIVVDGGSDDKTCENATQAGTSKLIRSFPGRGIQLNAGARFTTGEFILFLHADSRLSSACIRQICEHRDATWGAFRQKIESDRFVYRFLEFGNASRVRYLRLPFGDQGTFVRRSVFLQQGGFDEIPLMEDIALSRRLRRIDKPRLLPGPIHISARRWETTGVVRQTIRNWKIQAAHAVGVSPERLVEWYR